MKRGIMARLMGRLVTGCTVLMGAILLLAGCNGGGGTKVWSGHWWPYLPDTNLYDNSGPAEKYDQYVQAKTGVNPGWKAWEKGKHDGGPNVEGWWGHCHALVAASILEYEPTSTKTKQGVLFTVLDQKGMLTESHFDDPTDMFVGARYGWFNNDLSDPSPDKFHTTLVDWLGGPQQQQGEAIAMDANPKDQVWNYAIYAYDTKFTVDSANASKKHVTTTVYYAGYGPADPNYTGRDEKTKTYTYWLMPDVNSPTSGGWEGGSVNDHPDFLWHPAYQQKAPGCPIDYATVKQIVQ